MVQPEPSYHFETLLHKAFNTFNVSEKISWFSQLPCLDEKNIDEKMEYIGIYSRESLHGNAKNTSMPQKPTTNEHEK